MNLALGCGIKKVFLFQLDRETKNSVVKQAIYFDTYASCMLLGSAMSKASCESTA